MDNLLAKMLPIYVRFWPSNYWLAIWSHPLNMVGMWGAMRITIRGGKLQSRLVAVIKQGDYVNQFGPDGKPL